MPIGGGLYGGAGGGIPAPGLPGVKQEKHATLVESDKIQALAGVIPLMEISDEVFPNGIILDKILLSAETSVNMTVTIEKWTAPEDPSPIVMATVTLAAQKQVEVDPLLGGVVEAGRLVMIRLDTTDVDWIHVTPVFHGA